VAIAECLGEHRPEWELAAGRLGHAIAYLPGAFAPKNEFAMDWYDPMLSGAFEGTIDLAGPVCDQQHAGPCTAG